MDPEKTKLGMDPEKTQLGLFLNKQGTDEELNDKDKIAKIILETAPKLKTKLIFTDEVINNIIEKCNEQEVSESLIDELKPILQKQKKGGKRKSRKTNRKSLRKRKNTLTKRRYRK